MSDAIREALQTLRENIRQEGRTVQQIGIRDNDDTRSAIAVLMDNEAALQQTAPAVPEGWMLVPVEPTVEMRAAFHDANEEWEDGGLDSPDHQYRAMLAAAPQPDHSPDAGKVVQGEPVAGLVQVTSECFKQVLPWDEAKRQHAAILSASESLGSPGKGAELIPLYPHPAESREEIQYRGAIQSAIKMLRERFEGKRCDSDGVSGCIHCNIMFLCTQLEKLLAAAPQPDHIGDAGKMADMLREIVDMWDGPRYALQMKPLIDRARKMLQEMSSEMSSGCSNVYAAAADGGEVVQEPAGIACVGYGETVGQTGFTQYVRVKNLIPEGTKLYTRPAESREEIQAQALEKFADGIKAQAEDAKTIHHATFADWAETHARLEARRLRASQQEGG